jgi:hypothetical protein
MEITTTWEVAEINAHFTGTFTWAYQFPFDDTYKDARGRLGWPATTDPTLNGGSGGLILSATDLAAILAYFIHSDTEIISPAQRELMLELELGFIETISGVYGRYPSKGGTRGPDNKTDSRALRSRVVIYPNGVEAAVLTNSNHTGLAGLLEMAYDDAWVAPDC